MIIPPIVPSYNLPNLKQGQNGIKAALATYRIVLDVKVHLTMPKETVDSALIFVVIYFLVFTDFHFNIHSEPVAMLLFYRMHFLFSALFVFYFIITETMERCNGLVGTEGFLLFVRPNCFLDNPKERRFVYTY